MEQTGATFRSFETNLLRLRIGGQTTDYNLDNLNWALSVSTPEKATFSTTLTADGGAPLIRVTKTYALRQGAPVFDLQLGIENLSAGDAEASLIQDGPTGFPEEGRYMASRRLMAFTRKADGSAEMKSFLRSELTAAPRIVPRPERSEHVWAGVSNKYFGVFLRPIAAGDAKADFVRSITARLGAPELKTDLGDLILRFETTPRTIAHGAATSMTFEVYAGSKNTDHLRSANPAFVDRNSIGYVAAHDPDRGCCPCQFEWVNDLMIWALEKSYLICRNYGIAILLLVIVIRTLLHPLAVFQQKSMYRMQEAMVRIQPKLTAMREKYPNDKQKQAQEQMRIYAEENVNPAASLVGMIPLVVQMPILIGLWSALNNDVNLRHAPLDGWWIRDLSAPDSLIAFSPPVTIPVLSWLPLIGRAFTDIPSLNILPILMGVSMYLQQKYMPKPAMAMKQEAAKTQTAAGGMNPEEQLRQQQMMANMMSVMFPVMFYYQPAGLAVYWMFTNVFGIAESLRIRKQLEREKKLIAARGPVAAVPKRPSILGGIMKKMAQKAEEFQKKADELTKQEEGKKKDRNRKDDGDQRKDRDRKDKK
ncbi:MAG: YidC/Oxa1 family insertase periplasmic-domain containing protein [Planctomycetes bacterium]|nr:YidC/Oxa1 family insertase periplasmic-domain containing protein [Planctomycetota bacterium]